jgi:hypothetical protein
MTKKKETEEQKVTRCIGLADTFFRDFVGKEGESDAVAATITCLIKYAVQNNQADMMAAGMQKAAMTLSMLGMIDTILGSDDDEKEGATAH